MSATHVTDPARTTLGSMSTMLKAAKLQEEIKKPAARVVSDWVKVSC